MSGFERQNYLVEPRWPTPLAAALGYLAFGGWRLFGQTL